MLPFFAAVRVFEKMVRASKRCLLLQVLVVCLILVLAPLADGYSCSHEVYGSPTVVFLSCCLFQPCKANRTFLKGGLKDTVSRIELHTERKQQCKVWVKNDLFMVVDL